MLRPMKILFSFRLSTNNKIVKDNRCEDLEKQMHRFQPTPHAEENSLVNRNTNDVSKVEFFFEIKLIVEISNENYDVWWRKIFDKYFQDFFIIPISIGGSIDQWESRKFSFDIFRESSWWERNAFIYVNILIELITKTFFKTFNNHHDWRC